MDQLTLKISLFTVTFTAAIVFLVWQLRRVRKDRKAARESQSRRDIASDDAQASSAKS